MPRRTVSALSLEAASVNKRDLLPSAKRPKARLTVFIHANLQLTKGEWPVAQRSPHPYYYCCMRLMTVVRQLATVVLYALKRYAVRKSNFSCQETVCFALLPRNPSPQALQ